MNSNFENNTYSKADRFAKLSEKLSQLHSTSHNETMNPNPKFNLLENKILEIDNKMNDNFEVLDRKYNNLKDQITKLTKIIEEEKNSKELVKMKQIEDFRNLELQIKTLLEEEQVNMQNFADNLINKIDSQIHDMDKEYKNENEVIKNSISGLKESFENELTNINSRIDLDSEERVKIMRNLVNEMNTELGKVHELV